MGRKTLFIIEKKSEKKGQRHECFQGKAEYDIGKYSEQQQRKYGSRYSRMGKVKFVEDCL